MRTLFSSRIRGRLWGYCACNVVSLHYVPHQNLDRHRYPSRSLRRYSVSDARKTDSAYLCQRPFRPGVPALSSGAPFPRDVPKTAAVAGGDPRAPLFSATEIRNPIGGIADIRRSRCLLRSASSMALFKSAARRFRRGMSTLRCALDASSSPIVFQETPALVSGLNYED